MKPTTIYLPEETENQLQEIAHNEGKSIKKLSKSVGMGSNGRSDLSSKAEQLLWTEE